MAADVTGLGAAVNVRAPWNTILRADVGKSFLPARYRGVGSTRCPDDAAEAARSESRCRADLHVHTWHSTVSGTLTFLAAATATRSPRDVYRDREGARHGPRGHHRSRLDRRLRWSCSTAIPRPTDCHLGEEVSCRFPDGDIEVHLGVYGMTEALHRDLQPLRGNVFDVIARLREADVFFALNHLLHFYRGQVPLETYLRLLDRGAGARGAQRRDAAGAQRAHRALRRTGAAAAGARHGRRQRRAHAAARRHDVDRGARAPTRAEFLAGLRAGLGRPGGVNGGALASRPETRTAWSARYIASLAGIGPSRSSRLATRLGCLAFSVALAAVSVHVRRWSPSSARSSERREGRRGARRGWPQRPPVADDGPRRRSRQTSRRSDAASPSPASASSPRSARRARRPGGRCWPARAASARSPCSTRPAIAAGSRPKCPWTASHARANAARAPPPVARRSDRAARRRRGASTTAGLLDSAARSHRASACCSAPAPADLLRNEDYSITTLERRHRTRPSVGRLESLPQHARRRDRRAVRVRRAARVHRRRVLVEHDRDRPGGGRDSPRPRSTPSSPAAPTRWRG